MKSVSLIAGRCHAFFVLAVVLLFAAGCSKNEDDCPAPENNDTQATTRSCQAAPSEDGKGDEPSGINYRNTEVSDEDIDSGGISDDGDDEADGEGNKKNRPSH